MDRAAEPVKASGDWLAGSTAAVPSAAAAAWAGSAAPVWSGSRAGRPPDHRGLGGGVLGRRLRWRGGAGGGPVRPQREQLEQLDLVGHLEVDGVEVAPGPGRVGEAALGGGPERGHERPRPGHRGVERDPDLLAGDGQLLSGGRVPAGPLDPERQPEVAVGLLEQAVPDVPGVAGQPEAQVVRLELPAAVVQQGEQAGQGMVGGVGAPAGSSRPGPASPPRPST